MAKNLGLLLITPLLWPVLIISVCYCLTAPFIIFPAILFYSGFSFAGEQFAQLSVFSILLGGLTGLTFAGVAAIPGLIAMYFDDHGSFDLVDSYIWSLTNFIWTVAFWGIVILIANVAYGVIPII